VARVLYVSYDGMLEPLGQSQVIAYIEQLSDEYQFSLISFEKADDWRDASRRAALEQRLAAAGIEWHPLRYHKRPTLLATAYDIAHGMAAARRLDSRRRFDLIHARSHVSALIGSAVGSARQLFDLRGLWAEERIDGGLWPEGGRLFRAVKRAERRLLRRADAIVTLTEASVPIVTEWRDRAGGTGPVTVITTCADLDRFRPSAGLAERPFTLGYVGSLGTWYMVDEMLRLFAAVRSLRGDARLLIVNRHEHALVRERIAALGIDADAVDLRKAGPAEVPSEIHHMDAAMALIRPVFSKIASAPTKLGEYLGCGIPCVVNDRVGDMADIVTEDQVGIIVRGFSDEELADAAAAILALAGEPGIGQRCREAAERRFALSHGVAAYREVYREMLA
jgi:glycosyltransferase involved in cell wall biosynthesis